MAASLDLHSLSCEPRLYKGYTYSSVTSSEISGFQSLMNLWVMERAARHDICCPLVTESSQLEE
jgi:hypothetical protein